MLLLGYDDQALNTDNPRISHPSMEYINTLQYIFFPARVDRKKNQYTLLALGRVDKMNVKKIIYPFICRECRDGGGEGPYAIGASVTIFRL